MQKIIVQWTKNILLIIFFLAQIKYFLKNRTSIASLTYFDSYIICELLYELVTKVLTLSDFWVSHANNNYDYEYITNWGTENLKI